MNNQTPLIPQGSILEQKIKGRARVKLAVFVVLAVHGIGLMALLMAGCGQSKETAPPPETEMTNQPPAFVETTNVSPATSNPPVVATVPAAPEAPPASVAPAGATEYTIIKGDTLEKIAKNFHVSVAAITNANPGIQPTKLQIGKKIQIPAPVVPAPVPAASAAGESTAAGAEQIYTVKSGDNLTKIAQHFGTTIKALQAANGLKTYSIKVGQKLKIPAGASAPAAAPSTPAEPAPGTPSATPTTPPGS